MSKEMIDVTKLKHGSYYTVLSYGDWRIMKWTSRLECFQGSGLSNDIEPSEAIEVRGPIAATLLPIVTKAGTP